MAEAGVNEVPQGGGGGYPPPAHTVAGTYYDANWNEVNADGSPKKSGSTAVTYRQVVDTDGSLSGVPGATVQVSSTGSVSIISRPSTSGGGGGGGGAASQAGRYSTHVDTTGAITGIPGATYQEDSFDGSITVVNRPSASSGSFSNPLDKNNDGLNDSTGWANGVFKDSSSPSGFYYAANGTYVPVTPDGAPYNGPDLSGGAGGGSLKTITINGPKGYGSYVLNNDGSLGNFIGDTRAPSTAASSGTARPPTSSGGSSSGSASAQISAAASAASDAARAAQQAAHDAWQGDQNAADRNWKAAQAAIDRALKLAGDHAQFELTRTGLVQAQTKMLLDGAKQFADLVSSTDPIQYRAFLEAGGGDIWNGLFNGGTAVSDNANLGAARTLRAMENPTHIPTWDEMMAQGGLNVLNPPTMGAGGVGNTPVTGGVPVGGATGNTGDTNTGTGGSTATGAGGVGNAPQITLPPGYEPSTVGQKIIGGSGDGQTNMFSGSGSMMDFNVGRNYSGGPLTVQQLNDMANAAYENFQTDAYASPGHMAPRGYVPYATGAQVGTIVGSAPTIPFGNDQINREIPMQPQATVPQISKFATGGVMVGRMGIAGDSHTGRPNEEMVVNLNPDPNDQVAIVPMRDVRQMGMHQALAKAMGRGPVPVGGASRMPMAADGGIFGTDSYLNPITPEDRTYLDRVQAIRDSTDFSAWNPFRSDYFQGDPTIRDANEKAVQAARGVPQASLVSYAQRYALPGISRGGLRIGV